MINITYKGRIINEPEGTCLLDILLNNNIPKDYNYLVTAALVDNKIKELSYKVHSDCSVEFLDLSDKDARSIYMRSLSFVFLKALKNIDKNATCTIEHSLSNGLYMYIENPKSIINNSYMEQIHNEMQNIINQNLPFTREEYDTQEAVKIYQEQKKPEKAKMTSYRQNDKTIIYDLDGYKNYFYGFLLPSTGLLKIFDLQLYSGSLVLLGPDLQNPKVPTKFVHQPRLFSIYLESKAWSKTIEVPSVIYLNKKIEDGSYSDLIRCCEAYQEKKICEIADAITNDPDKRVILIAGPSSSGKTSFAQRLRLQLMVNKKRPISISVDNYFINRIYTPKDEYGRPNFETIRSIDLDKFNEDLENLLLGKEVKMPVYNFITGEREPIEDSPITKIDSDQPIIIEGIHCLNPMLTESISYKNKYRIYISALTPLNLDKHNRIQTTDVRLIRRIIRDNSHRGSTAEDTMNMWENVNIGERENIFVYQENADAMFNSALIYEIAVMKKYIKPLLEEISENSEHYRTARHMLKFLQYFKSIDDESDIPATSVLREFIGGSKIVH